MMVGVVSGRPHLIGMLQHGARLARGVLLDLQDAVTGKRDPELPPRRLRAFVGGDDYREAGAEFKRHFIELGGLDSHDDVLDVGSGSGRMAFALKGWLEGRYEGFDVYREGVEWCRRSITPSHPNFRFHVADIANPRYNPAGRYSAETYRFPYDDDSFDFAFLTSVFTHLRPSEVGNYLAELARVLRPGGTCFATYFLINEEALGLMGGLGRFSVDRGEYLTTSVTVPERAMAYREEHVRDAHDRYGLAIERIHYGSWPGRTEFASGQDIVIARRRA